MKRNPGHLPREAAGRRVRGRLANGDRFDSWPADGRGGCRWTLTGHPYDITHFEVVP